MLAVIEEHGLIFLVCLKEFVSFVAIVKKVEANLVERQRGAQQNKDCDMQVAFFHTVKIRIFKFAHGRS